MITRISRSGEYNKIDFEADLIAEGLHMRIVAICVVLLCQFSFAQNNSSQEDTRATAYCDFDDGQEVSVRYSDAAATSKDEPHNGRIWMPGGSAITMFTGTTLTLNNSVIAPGAYSVYVIPNKKDWTFIVNKSINASAAYDEKQDIARTPMELGEVNSAPRQLQVSFAHTGPKVCSIRLYYGKIGAFAEFTQK
jgi:hypothetical protein